MAQHTEIHPDRFLLNARLHIDKHDKFNLGRFARECYDLAGFPTDKDVRQVLLKQILGIICKEIEEGDDDRKKEKIRPYLLKNQKNIVNNVTIHGNVAGDVNIANGDTNQVINHQPQKNKRPRESSEEPEDASDVECNVKKLRMQLQHTIPPEPPKPQSLRQNLIVLHQQATRASRQYESSLNIAFAALSDMNRAHKRMEETLERLSFLLEDPVLRQNDDWLTSRDKTPSE